MPENEQRVNKDDKDNNFTHSENFIPRSSECVYAKSGHTVQCLEEKTDSAEFERNRPAADGSDHKTWSHRVARSSCVCASVTTPAVSEVTRTSDMMMTNAADELASSLRCAEFLADSPSTSTLMHHQPTTVGRITNVQYAHHQEHRRRSGRMVLQPVNQRKLSHGQENLKTNHLYFTAVQEHIEPIHREQAVEWIYDVAKEEKCDADVFPLAVSLIDRFLSLQNIFRQDIQVLAGVCLFIASKVKAPQPMNAARVSYYTADSVKVHDVLSHVPPGPPGVADNVPRL
ncbi:cyclin domain protein [Necator americanus]|uniref:Cyclin domain protein n=1 Tax=Necator americanus TaxID=51031 RepID=W2SYU2_NECAM|nr:cyclin domain protein [Necator americanus]ETN73807.1 cyclin domain protein [Necator americanus]